MCINSLYSAVKNSQANYSTEISYFHDGYESIHNIIQHNKYNNINIIINIIK